MKQITEGTLQSDNCLDLSFWTRYGTSNTTNGEGNIYI